MALIYINPILNTVIFAGIAVLAIVVVYYSLVAGRKEIELSEEEDRARFVERRSLH